MEAVGYVRVSTEAQASEGVSLEAQKAKIEAWCLANGARLIALHVDAGLSGGRADNRPELQKALDAVCDAGGSERKPGRRKSQATDPPGRVLVVYSLSRLARSVRDTIAISERLSLAHADLVSLSEKIDTTSAAGKMVFRMLAVLAEFERDLVSERTQLALQHKRGRRERVGAVPFGFDLGDDGVRLIENPDQQRIIARIGELRGLGMSSRKIAAMLEADGVPAKGGSRWHHRTVLNLLQRTCGTQIGET